MAGLAGHASCVPALRRGVQTIGNREDQAQAKEGGEKEGGEREDREGVDRESAGERVTARVFGGEPPRGSAVRPPAQSERTAIGGKASWDSLTMLSLSGCWVKIFFEGHSTNHREPLQPAAFWWNKISVFFRLCENRRRPGDSLDFRRRRRLAPWPKRAPENGLNQWVLPGSLAGHRHPTRFLDRRDL